MAAEPITSISPVAITNAAIGLAHHLNAMSYWALFQALRAIIVVLWFLLLSGNKFPTPLAKDRGRTTRNREVALEADS